MKALRAIPQSGIQRHPLAETVICFGESLQESPYPRKQNKRN
jgi:hypothetical protein